MEWAFAAHWRGYKDEEFAELDGEDQARIVAEYRIYHQIEAVLANEQAKAAARRARHKPATP